MVQVSVRGQWEKRPAFMGSRWVWIPLAISSLLVVFAWLLDAAGLLTSNAKVVIFFGGSCGSLFGVLLLSLVVHYWPRYSWRTLMIFTLLVTSGMGLWWHWEAWVKARVLHCGTGYILHSADFNDDGKEIRVLALEAFEGANDIVMFVFDATTGMKLRIEERPSTASSPQGGATEVPASTGSRGDPPLPERSQPPTHYRATSPDGTRVAVSSAGFTDMTVSVQDLRTRQPLAVVESECFPSAGAEFAPSVAFSPDGQELLVAGGGSMHLRWNDARIYRRRRPEWWWGVFWLWEFWLTVAFAGVFVWSVVRDRRALGKREAA